MKPPIDKKIIGPVARDLLGDPNSALSRKISTVNTGRNYASAQAHAPAIGGVL
jgi:hypothetical protein